MEWINKNIDLGEVKEKTTQTIIFTSKEDLPTNISLSSSCGCSKPTKIDKRRIKVVYKTSRVPEHLLDKGYYISKKFIYITNNHSGAEDVLSFRAVIKKA